MDGRGPAPFGGGGYCPGGGACIYACGARGGVSESYSFIKNLSVDVRGIWPICGDAYMAAKWQIE